MTTRRKSSRLPTTKPEPPHGALGEIREVIPTKRSHLRVLVPKSERRYKPNQKK
jgi:hypothetical protein